MRDERVDDGGAMKDGSSHRTTGFTYDVKYVMGGSERRVDAQHISSKVLATRHELGEQRQEEQQRKKEERERAEAEARRLEEERAERKRRARAELAKRRAAKSSTAKKPKRRKLAAQATSAHDDQAAADDEPARLAASEADPDSEQLLWLRDVLVNRVPRAEAPDEINLNDLLETVATSNDKPRALADVSRLVLLPLLAKLEEANLIMRVEDMIFVV